MFLLGNNRPGLIAHQERFNRNKLNVTGAGSPSVSCRSLCDVAERIRSGRTDARARGSFGVSH